MNALTVENTEIAVKEYNGQRVVTFKDIDNVHQRKDGTARKRFVDNREHFIEGEDYYKVSLSEIRTMGIMGGNYPQGLTLITESGYLMLVKSFTDDLAWAVQRQLINVYFRFTVAEIVIPEFTIDKVDWLKIADIIRKTPRERFGYLLVALNKLAPNYFIKEKIDDVTLKFHAVPATCHTLKNAVSNNTREIHD